MLERIAEREGDTLTILELGKGVPADRELAIEVHRLHEAGNFSGGFAYEGGGDDAETEILNIRLTARGCSRRGCVAAG